MRKGLRLWKVTVIAAAVAVLTACGSSAKTGQETAVSASTAEKSQGGETAAEGNAEFTESASQETDITAAVKVDFTTMDPVDTSDTLSGGIQRMMMDGMFGFDDDMKIYPMLATGYEANDNATEFTITLRKGISFTDGTPWNADAAIANLEKLGNKNLGLKRTTLLCNVLDHADKIDDYTIKVTLVQPFGAFINTLAHPACVMMSPKQIEAGPSACAENPIGTGQYKFVEWVPGDHLKLELNKDWWGYNADICDGNPLAESDAGFKSIVFKPVGEGATRVAMIQSGDAQIIWPAPTESMEALKSDTNITVNKGQSIVVWYFMMNNQKAPFNDVKVRQAVSYAINKEAYVQVVMNGLGTPATSVIGPAVQYYKANDPLAYDPAKAKELLTEAGYPNGFTAKLMYANTSENQKRAEFYKQQLAAVGINLELNGMESAILNQKVQGATGSGADAEVEFYMSGWSPSTGDADWGIRPILAKESEPPMSYNICYYENDELENYIKTGLQSADDSVRKEAYAKAQDLIWKDVPMVCVASDYNTWVTSNKVTGVKIYPDGAINMKNARMSK
ncbi:ABC transporter substrate-binding protein [Lacrimispora sp. 38-1]|uniref:ABC transporter substrate-binding protein n=1 Tax=Lacrimispora sp. 38-1 TaxID=3125778 RepID=UPI003CF31500